MSKYTPYYDPAKALSHCEFILEDIDNDNMSTRGYEFLFNSFMFQINQAWELTEKAYENASNDVPEIENIISDVDDNRYRNDELLIYVRQARNQLSHRESVLWISRLEKKPNNIGKTIKFGPETHTVGADSKTENHSLAVLPSMDLNFTSTEIALKPISDKYGNKVEVPDQHIGEEISNSPTDIMKLSYDYYGSNFSKIVDLDREFERNNK